MNKKLKNKIKLIIYKLVIKANLTLHLIKTKKETKIKFLKLGSLDL